MENVQSSAINAAHFINAQRDALELPKIDVDRIGKAVISEENTARAAEEAKAVQKANQATLTAAYRVIAKDDAGNYRDLSVVLETLFVPRTKARLQKIISLMKSDKVSYKEAYERTVNDETAVAGNETRAYMLVAKARTNAMKKEKEAADAQVAKEQELTEKQKIAAQQEELQRQQEAIIARSEQLDQEKKQAIDAVQRELNDVKISSDQRIAELLQELALANKTIAEKQAEVADLQAANKALTEELTETKQALIASKAKGKKAVPA